MANILDPTTPTQILKVRPNGAAALNLIPTEGGQYSAGWETPSLAFTSNVVVWDFRNNSANLVLITTVQAAIVEMAIAAASATGLRAALQLFVGRSYTAQSATAATALTLTGNNAKLRTSYAATNAQIGVANATSGIFGGTVTEDATPLATASIGVQDPNITAAVSPGTPQQKSQPNPLLWTATPWDGPIVLAANEGVRIKYLVTTVAAVIVSGYVKWSELGTAVYP